MESSQHTQVVGSSPAVSKPFKCDECGAHFHCGAFLDNHKKYHYGEHPYICGICHYSFDNPKTLKLHMMVHQKYSCEICYDSFKDPKDLDHHVKIAHQNARNQATSSVIQQGASVIQESVGVVRLPTELVSTGIKEEPTCHYTTDYEGTIKEFQCDECSIMLRHESILYNHLKFHRGEYPFMCNVCHNSFKHLRSFIEHKRANPEETSRMLQQANYDDSLSCVYCGIVFRCKPFIENHLKFHSGVNPFLCNVCYYSFDELKTLIRHKQIHGFEMPFSCGQCSAVFHREGDFDKHLLLHSDYGKEEYTVHETHNEFVGDTTEKSNQTQYMESDSMPAHNLDSNSASAENSTAATLQQISNNIFISQSVQCNDENMLTSEGGVNMVLIPLEAIVMDQDGLSMPTVGSSTLPSIQIDNKKKPKTPPEKKLKTQKKAAPVTAVYPTNNEFHCYECQVQFRCQVLLDNHLKFHTGENPFMCDSCHYTFNNAGTLTKHKYVHQDQKPYECDACHGTFRRQFELDRHRKKCLSLSGQPTSATTTTTTTTARTPKPKLAKLIVQKRNITTAPSPKAPEPVVEQQQQQQQFYTNSYVYENDKTITTTGNELNQGMLQNIQNLVLISNLMGGEEFNGGNGAQGGVNYVVMQTDDQGTWNYPATQQALATVKQEQDIPVTYQTIQTPVQNQQGDYQNGICSYINLQPAARSYKCAECGLEYQNEFDLDSHLLSHSGERTYMCDICHYAFDNIENLNAHAKIHAEEFTRNNCGQTYERVYDNRGVETQTQMSSTQDHDQFKKMDILTASLLSSNIVDLVSEEEPRVLHENAITLPSCPQTNYQNEQIMHQYQSQAVSQNDLCSQANNTNSYSNSLSISNGLLTQTYGVISKCNNDQESVPTSSGWHTEYKTYSVEQASNQETIHSVASTDNIVCKQESDERNAVSNCRNIALGSDKEPIHLSDENYGVAPTYQTFTNIGVPQGCLESVKLEIPLTVKDEAGTSGMSHMLFKQDTLDPKMDKSNPVVIKTCRVELERLKFEGFQNGKRWSTDLLPESVTVLEEAKSNGEKPPTIRKPCLVTVPKVPKTDGPPKKTGGKKRTKQKSPVKKKSKKL